MVAKPSICGIRVEDIRAIVADEDIRVPVVVVVSCGNPDSITSIVSCGSNGHIGKCPVALVSEEPIRLHDFGTGFQGVAIHGVDVQFAVPVVVQKRTTGPHSLDEKLLPRAAVGVAKIDASLVGHIDESDGRLKCRSRDQRAAEDDPCE